MIQSLKIQNFQSHKESSLEFVPGLNVIVGSTDSGKTSIIRALRWLVWNRPGGEAFRSDWGGITSVEIKINERNSIESGAHKDYTLIQRLKSDKYNQYFLNGTDNLFQGFGSNVPEKIAEILNITEVNLQMQLDAHFLLSKSPGEVAAYFNRIAHLEKIDTVTRYIMSGLRDLERSQKQDVKEIETLEEEFTTYDYLDKVEAELEVLEDLEKNWETKTKTLNSLEHTINQIEGTNTDIEQHDRTLSLKKPVEELLELHEKKVDTWLLLEHIKEACEEISKIDADLEYHQNILIAIPNHVDLLLDLHKQRNTKEEYQESLSTLLESIYSHDTFIKNYKKDLEKMEAEFHENLGEICPLCGNETN